MNENLQSNAFFLALLDHIPDLEQSCVAKRWIVCVPQTPALPESHRMSLRLLRMHVLIPVNDTGSYTTLNPSVMVQRVGEKDLDVKTGSSEITSTFNTSNCYIG